MRVIDISGKKITIEFSYSEFDVINEALLAGDQYFDTISDYAIDVEQKDLETLAIETTKIFTKMTELKTTAFEKDENIL